MLKKFFVYLLGLVLVVGTVVYVFDLADDKAAVKTLRDKVGENQLVSFNPNSDYVRVANKVDGFDLPAYHWTVRRWRRQGLLFYLSQAPLLKTVMFTQGGRKAEVVYFRSETLGRNKVKSGLKKGILLKATIYTGVPEDTTGMNVSPNMLRTRKKAKSGIVYTDNQLNSKQLDIFNQGVLVPESITLIQK